METNSASNMELNSCSCSFAGSSRTFYPPPTSHHLALQVRLVHFLPPFFSSSRTLNIEHPPPPPPPSKLKWGPPTD